MAVIPFTQRIEHVVGRFKVGKRLALLGSRVVGKTQGRGHVVHGIFELVAQTGMEFLGIEHHPQHGRNIATRP